MFSRLMLFCFFVIGIWIFCVFQVKKVCITWLIFMFRYFKQIFIVFFIFLKDKIFEFSALKRMKVSADDVLENSVKIIHKCLLTFMVTIYKSAFFVSKLISHEAKETYVKPEAASSHCFYNLFEIILQTFLLICDCSTLMSRPDLYIFFIIL